MARSVMRDLALKKEWAWRELLKYGGHQRNCAAIRLVAQGACNCGWDTAKKVAQDRVTVGS